MLPADRIAIVAVAVSCISLLISWLAYKLASKQSEQDLLRSQAESEMELFSLWDGIRLLDQNEPSLAQAARGHKPLLATARRWVHDRTQRQVLVKNFRADYIGLYESFRDCKGEFSDLGKKPSNYLTDEMHQAYAEMKAIKE